MHCLDIVLKCKSGYDCCSFIMLPIINAYKIVIIIIELISLIDQFPVYHGDIKDAYNYLKKYNYLIHQVNQDTEILRSNELKDFQRMVHISETGILDEQTLVAMKWKRCGTIDTVAESTSKRKKRFAFQGSQWADTKVLYKISQYSTQLSRDIVEKEIKKAFETWSRHSNLIFIQSYDAKEKVDIDIKFTVYQHYDGEGFDGPGNILAHAFYPNEGGYTHFDDSENWTNQVGTYGGVDLYQVATHELGHALGLMHSDKRESVMTPFYKEWEYKIDLDIDDIIAIQLMYGKPSKQHPIDANLDTNSNITKAKIKICSYKSIDAVLKLPNRSLYTFGGEYFWELLAGGMRNVRLTREVWKELPASLDSAIYWQKRNKTFFFKGAQYWRYTDTILDINYPRLIVNGFKGIPDNINAVFEWDETNVLFFIKEKSYYRYSGATHAMDINYPKPLDLWHGLPVKVDAALKWNEAQTYFFSGEYYYRFNDKKFKVARTYPRRWKTWWLGCKNAA